MFKLVQLDTTAKLEKLNKTVLISKKKAHDSPNMIYSYKNHSFVDLDTKQVKLKEYPSADINSDINIKVIFGLYCIRTTKQQEK